jgi:metal-responsive CopG/Arc/MetJ family transcriptional regulator
MKKNICITLPPEVVDRIATEFPLVKRSNAIQHLLQKALSDMET